MRTDGERHLARERGILKARATKAMHRATAKHAAMAEVRGAAYAVGLEMLRGAAERSVLAFDPGPRAAGWCLVRATSTSEVEFVDAGSLPLDEACTLIENAKGAVAVEGTFWTPRIPNGEQVMATLRMEERLAAHARYRLRRLAIVLTANDARAHMGLAGVGAKGRTLADNAVDAVVRRWVKGLDESNVHERDAMLLALAASRLIGPAWFQPKER